MQFHQKQRTAPAPFTNITNLPLQHSDETANQRISSVPLHQQGNRGRTPIPPPRQTWQHDEHHRVSQTSETSPSPQLFSRQVNRVENDELSSSTMQEARSNPYDTARKTKTHNRTMTSSSGNRSYTHHDSTSKQHVSNPYSIQPTSSSHRIQHTEKTEEKNPRWKRNTDEMKIASSTTIPVPIDLTSPASTNASISSVSSTLSISKGASNKFNL